MDNDIIIFPNRNFGIQKKLDKHPSNKSFELHNHNDMYEIMLLLQGECKFYVEGNIYKIKPMDILITRPTELHRIYCSPDVPYERIILFVTREYFVKHECSEFLTLFEDRKIGMRNIISGAQNSAVECMERLWLYQSEGAYGVCESVVTEFLYLLSRTPYLPTDINVCDKRIRDIILYINSSLCGELSLDALADRFYINKYYLCKSFKKNMGCTVGQYISCKRVLLAQELYKNGQTLTEAAVNAGFNSYSQFYRAYVRYMGASPAGRANSHEIDAL